MAQARTHFLAALELQQAGRLHEAEALYRKAHALVPERESVAINLAAVLLRLQRFDEASALCERVLQANPQSAEAWLNLATCRMELAQPLPALDAVERAIALRPDYVEALDNRGCLLLDLERIDEALECFDRALRAQPGCAEALANRGQALRRLGRDEDALASYRRAFELEESPAARQGIVACLRALPGRVADDGLRSLLQRALTEPWCQPSELAGVGTRVLRQHPEIDGCMRRAAQAWPQRLAPTALFGAAGLAAANPDGVLHALLVGDLVLGLEMERFLTLARAALLDAAAAAAADGAGAALDFHCALAQQCFINEYVYDLAAGELEQALQLRERLMAALDAGAAFPASWLAAVGCYLPLHTLPAAGRLPGMAWPAAVGPLLAQQIAEPAEELRLCATIPALTAIADTTSTRVRQQYEENPYPRWVRLPPLRPAASLAAHLRQLSRKPLRVADAPGTADAADAILIAGCGTGRQALQAAQKFPQADILAVDLSLTSLAFAMRKTRELGIENIRYAQADIMQLGGLGRRFDYIECVGVLHHLADPLAGWRIVLSLLKPGGIMRIGLYSELARQAVVAAREHIAARGHAADAAAIRRCRQELIAGEQRARFAPLLAFRDFYSTSDCRDLLFHVQEHRYTLPLLRQNLAELGLEFLGFDLRADAVRGYAARFPGTAAATDLDLWHQFELEHPATFVEMYQFHVRRRA